MGKIFSIEVVGQATHFKRKASHYLFEKYDQMCRMCPGGCFPERENSLKMIAVLEE